MTFTALPTTYEQALAEVARLRITLEQASEALVYVNVNSESTTTRMMVDAIRKDMAPALAATSSAEWLKKREEEVIERCAIVAKEKFNTLGDGATARLAGYDIAAAIRALKG